MEARVEEHFSPYQGNVPVWLAEETERVKKGGGTILKGRLAGNLLITRSLGDFDMQEYGLISTPDIYESLLFKNKLVFLASDGIWDVINTIQLLQLLKANSGKTLAQLAESIVKYAVDHGSMDNISIVIVLMIGQTYDSSGTDR